MLYGFETIRNNRALQSSMVARAHEHQMFFINHELASKQYAFAFAIAIAIALTIAIV